MPRQREGATSSAQRRQTIAQQLAVLNTLRSGKGIAAEPASPILRAGRGLMGKPAAIGTVYGAELDGKSVLRMPGGMKETGFIGPINVAGRTWYPAKSGEDIIYMQGTKSTGFGRPANAAEADDGRVSGLFKGIAGSDIGGDGSSDEARALTSQYAPKTFPLTPEGQFGRYFGGSEMDQYFGAASRGKGAPKTAEEALTLASGKGTPEGVGIATKYRAESAMGRGNMDEIVAAMGYKGSPMEQWARNNPMLAFREYNKKFPAGEPTIGPTPAALQPSEGPMKAFGQEVKTFFPGAEPGATEDFGLPANPVPPTEQPGPGGMTQGERIAYFRGAENIVPEQAKFTSGSAMPAFETTNDPGKAFLARKISALF